MTQCSVDAGPGKCARKAGRRTLAASEFGTSNGQVAGPLFLFIFHYSMEKMFAVMTVKQEFNSSEQEGTAKYVWDQRFCPIQSDCMAG
ncbi:hypothetical protein H920_15061 [Fukomys damarensis]|uniref:Uncharacterized protein n=1 Tax=Fukomys damarensis TaxID=885580 RepID=A0A091CV64_FUKDA|nr:hypothetical protein H920_15061 [Fukomys damarensis]